MMRSSRIRAVTCACILGGLPHAILAEEWDEPTIDAIIELVGSVATDPQALYAEFDRFIPGTVEGGVRGQSAFSPHMTSVWGMYASTQGFLDDASHGPILVMAYCNIHDADAVAAARALSTGETSDMDRSLRRSGEVLTRDLVGLNLSAGVFSADRQLVQVCTITVGLTGQAPFAAETIDATVRATFQDIVTDPERLTIDLDLNDVPATEFAIRGRATAGEEGLLFLDVRSGPSKYPPVYVTTFSAVSIQFDS